MIMTPGIVFLIIYGIIVLLIYILFKRIKTNNKLLKKDIPLVITIITIITMWIILEKAINYSVDIKGAFEHKYPNEIIEIYKKNDNIYSVIYKEKNYYAVTSFEQNGYLWKELKNVKKINYIYNKECMLYTNTTSNTEKIPFVLSCIDNKAISTKAKEKEYIVKAPTGKEYNKKRYKYTGNFNYNATYYYGQLESNQEYLIINEEKISIK